MRTQRSLALLLAGLFLLALPASDATAQTAVVVSCTGVPTTDGTNLRNAYNGVTGASATSPYVVQAEPCVYDLGTTTLDLKSFVDLDGSGRNVTIVTSSVDRTASPNEGTITVPSGADVEISNLTVRNEDATEGYALRNASSLLVAEDVIFEATSAEDAVAVHTIGRFRGIDLVLRAIVNGEEVLVARAVGLEDIAGDSVVTDALITAGGDAGTDIFGVLLEASDATLEEVTVIAGGPVAVTGIDVASSVRGVSRPQIRNSKVFVTGGTGTAAGVEVTGDSNVVTLEDLRITAGDGTAAGYGILSNDASSVLLTNVTATAVGGTSAIGLRAVDGLARLDRSTAEGDDGSVTIDAAATFRAGASKLGGPRSISGTATCVGTYDAAYTAIPTTC